MFWYLFYASNLFLGKAVITIKTSSNSDVPIIILINLLLSVKLHED